MICRLTAALMCLAAPALAGVVDGDSPDPLTELNALYGKICQWDEGTEIPYEVIDLTHDGVDDYLLTYDLSCRGQANAFAGSAGMTRQIWVSNGAGYLRVLDLNTRDLRIDMREGRDFVTVQVVGNVCMTADDAPCFLTMEFTGTELIWAERQYQHPSIHARMDAEAAAQEETTND